MTHIIMRIRVKERVQTEISNNRGTGKVPITGNFTQKYSKQIIKASRSIWWEEDS